MIMSKHGRGMILHDNGDKFVGQLKEDSKDWPGKWYTETGEIYEIPFQNDEMHGIGWHTLGNGDKTQIEFNFGTLIK